jgi:serine/threonine protein kinase
MHSLTLFARFLSHSHSPCCVSDMGLFTPLRDYSLISELGRGGNGVVFLGQSTRDDTRFKAVKVAKNSSFNMLGREHALMTKLDHINVVKVDDIQFSEDGVSLVGCSVSDYFQKMAREPLSSSHCLLWCSVSDLKAAVAIAEL